MSEISIHDIIEHMIHVEHAHHTLCDRELSSLGMYRSQLRMLMHLWRQGGAASQKTLADELHITAAVVTVTLQKLAADGYVTRVQSNEDKRVVNISLTQAGEDMVFRAHGILDGVDKKMLSGLTEEEKNNLVSYYKRMFENLKGEAESDA